MTQLRTPDGEVVRTLNLLAVAAVAALPLVAQRVLADALGWHVFYLADPGAQFLYAAPVLLIGGWPFLRGAGNTLRPGSADRGGLVALAATVAFTYSAYLTFAAPVAGPPRARYLEAVAIVALALLGRLLAALAGKPAPAPDRPGLAAALLVPGVVAVATLTLVAQLAQGGGLDHGVWDAVTVLAVACPELVARAGRHRQWALAANAAAVAAAAAGLVPVLPAAAIGALGWVPAAGPSGRDGH